MQMKNQLNLKALTKEQGGQIVSFNFSTYGLFILSYS